VNFAESFQFTVDKTDILRVMVYETAMVGWVDIPMTDFFGKSGVFPKGDSKFGAETAPNALEDGKKKAADAFGGFNAFGGDTAENGDDDDVELVPRQATQAPTHSDDADHGQPSAEVSPRENAGGSLSRNGDTLPPENHLLIDDWFPLEGQDVGGEIHLRLERVPLPDAPKQSRSGCCVM
jgi:hypothetical protein